MNINRILKSIGAALLLCIVISSSGLSQKDERSQMGTGFTYQGQLEVNDEPYTGNCDLKFSLYDGETGGTQISPSNNINEDNVVDGLLSVLLDFGSEAFNGDARWLEIQVRCPAGTGTYQTLSPRQPLNPAPYALALPGLWTQQHAISPNLIGGYSGNEIAADLHGGTIAGGGQAGENCGPFENLPCWNKVIGFWGSIGGGAGNLASVYSTVSGGYHNYASGSRSTISGGQDNTAIGYESTIAGGLKNEASGKGATIGGGYVNIANGSYCTVGGGSHNDANASYSTIAGGGPNDPDSYPPLLYNRATDEYCSIGGGGNNQAGDDDEILDDATYATISGGSSNSATHAFSTIGGGEGNQATNRFATVGGGLDNIASGYNATVGGGEVNLATDISCIVGGGYNNQAGNNNEILDDANYATVVGGLGNISSGGTSFIGGGSNNVSSGEASSVVGGDLNLATDNFCVIGGGYNNQAGDDDEFPDNMPYATISGGLDNMASSIFSTVGGGSSNMASGEASNVGGGYDNTASGGRSTVGGGEYNLATDDYCIIVGGENNQAGNNNSIPMDATFATVAGGSSNSATHDFSTIGGGEGNLASDGYATVGGGRINNASGYHATVAGGESNEATGDRAFAGGGTDNIASGNYSTAPGGINNTAQGNYSFAAGRRAKANHPGSFVWGDSWDLDVASSTNNQFVVRATGGVYFYTNEYLTSGMFLDSGGSSWVGVSNRELKENFTTVDTTLLLKNLSEVPVTTWNYKSQDNSIRHIGLMADEFNGLIDGLGGEGLDYVNTMDATGVALAAIQGLYAENLALKEQIEDLETRLSALEGSGQTVPLARGGSSTQWLLAFGMIVAVGGAYMFRRRGSGER